MSLTVYTFKHSHILTLSPEIETNSKKLDKTKIKWFFNDQQKLEPLGNWLQA